MGNDDIIDEFDFNKNKSLNNTNKPILYRRSKHKDELEQIIEVLKTNGVYYELEDNSVPQEISFAANTLLNEVELKLWPGDFEKANKLIQKAINIEIDQMDSDYYLFDFNNEELLDILSKPDEWGDLDYKLSSKILKQRGVEITDEEIGKLKSKRIEQLSKTERVKKPVLIIGFILALLGGFLGILIGWYIWSSKKTLPDGQRVYDYSKSDRRQGKVIMITGLVILLLALVTNLLYKYLVYWS